MKSFSSSPSHSTHVLRNSRSVLPRFGIWLVQVRARTRRRSVAERRLRVARAFKPWNQFVRAHRRGATFARINNRLANPGSKRRFATDTMGTRDPGLESPGYPQASLRDETCQRDTVLRDGRTLGGGMLR